MSRQHNHRPLASFIALVAAASNACAGTSIKDELLKTPWQFGLVGQARSLPAGLAFQKGVTASVLRLLPNGEARIELPCRNEQLIKEVGEEPIFVGTWTLSDDNQLTYTVSFRGHPKTESAKVSIDGDELHLTVASGKVRKAGRFYGNVQEACRYE